MARAGILGEDDRVELIDGEIVKKMTIGPSHASVVVRLNRFFSGLAGDHFVVSVQNPVALGEFSEPEPDLMLLKLRPDFYAEAHPRPEDVLLLIEVAESSLEVDTEVKVPLYARHRIREVWLVDLFGRNVTVYRQPENGRYAQKKIFGPGQILPLSHPSGESLAISELGI